VCGNSTVLKALVEEGARPELSTELKWLSVIERLQEVRAELVRLRRQK